MMYFYILSLLFSFIKINSLDVEKGAIIGAYLSTPNISELQFRLGNGLGYIGNGWDDEKLAKMSALAGDDGQRKKLPEQHFVNWGYDIEVGDCKKNVEYGILDIVGYLATPTKAHSSNATDNSELCYPANLYEPIWLEDGNVNPNNYWAAYVNKTVSIYKDYVKIWEVWNEPDYTQNYGAVDSWANSPPEPKDLSHWYGTIFQYIRLQRITYEVAKKIDPSCWVATGGLGYPNFVDAIMRYTDEPNNGEVTEEYPAFGGAYFDCDAFHQYPQYGLTDIQTGENIFENGSDSLAKKFVTLKKNHRYVISKYGFGSKYPEKLYINTETGLDSELKGNNAGGDLVRRNFILKMALLCLEYDIKQVHMLVINDNGGGMGDYENLGKFTSIEEGFKNIKSSTKGRITLQKIHIGKMGFDEEKTKTLRDSLPEGMTGIVLKRKFPKEDKEEYYSEYIYSIWLYCKMEEVEEKIEIELDLPFDPLKLDWLGKEELLKKNSKISISSTPIFLLEQN